MLGKVVTPRALDWLRNSRSARVLHLFDGVCNLVNERDEVLSLVSPRIGPGPFTAVLEGDLPHDLSASDAVALHPSTDSLRVGHLSVDLTRAAVWQPKPDWARLQAFDVTGYPLAELPPTIGDTLRRALDSIAAGEWPACRSAVERLAGRGEGLTPAGDDVLMGVMYGLWVWGAREAWSQRIAETAAPRTTTLSAAFLRAAAAGEAVWQWHDLANGRPGAAGSILAIGQTSGADTWAGFARAWVVLKDRFPASSMWS